MLRNRILNSFRIWNRTRKARFVVGLMHEHRVESVLLVGVGGTATYERVVESQIAKHAKHVVYSDIWAREGSTEFVQCDGRRLPFRDESFDLVFSNAVVEHVGDEPDQRQFLSEHDRVGRLWVTTTPNRWFPVEAHTGVVLAHWREVWRQENRGIFTRLLSKKEFGLLVPPTASIKGHHWSPTFIATNSSDPRRRVHVTEMTE